jgi:hypothetical protein
MDSEKFHDRGCKSLFSHPRMVEELIRSFVREEFVQDIDFSTLNRTLNFIPLLWGGNQGGGVICPIFEVKEGEASDAQCAPECA